MSNATAELKKADILKTAPAPVIDPLFESLMWNTSWYTAADINDIKMQSVPAPEPEDNIVSDYLGRLLDVEMSRKLLEKAEIALRKYDYDAIAFRGVSGALFAIRLAERLGKPLIVVRKPNDGTHSCCRVEGYLSAKRYIIADDFINSGNTVATIVATLKAERMKGKCLGVITMRELNSAPDAADYELETINEELVKRIYETL